MSLQVKSLGGVAPPYRLSQVACCAYPSCLCTPIVSHFWRFVKGFFYFFLGAVGDLNPHFNILPTLGGYSNLLARMCWRCDLNAHHPFADSTEDTSRRWENPTRTGGVAHRGDSPQPTHTICVLYPYCITTWVICQRVFDNFFILFGGFGTDRR